MRAVIAVTETPGLGKMSCGQAAVASDDSPSLLVAVGRSPEMSGQEWRPYGGSLSQTGDEDRSRSLVSPCSVMSSLW